MSKKRHKSDKKDDERFGRLAVPVINDKEDYHFEIGKGITLREGKDVTIIATGLEVSECLEAAKLLEEDGIDAEVINIHTIKPIDKDLILASAMTKSIPVSWDAFCYYKLSKPIVMDEVIKTIARNLDR